jgi:hypothetical protein
MKTRGPSYRGTLPSPPTLIFADVLRLILGGVPALCAGTKSSYGKLVEATL